MEGKWRSQGKEAVAGLRREESVVNWKMIEVATPPTNIGAPPWVIEMEERWESQAFIG